jgi:hypothetical protein
VTIPPRRIAGELRVVAAEIMDFADGPRNRGPFEQEIYRANVQISSALVMLADRLEALEETSG